MLRHFLNLRKRLKIRHLVVVCACSAASSQAASLGGFDRIMTTAYDPGAYEAVIQAMAKTGERDQIEALRIRGLNPSFAQTLWNLPASEILTLNFSTARQPIASDAVARSFGISNQNRAAHFRQMLAALRAQWAKQGKKFTLSDTEIEKLVQLLANGQGVGDMAIDPKMLAALQTSADKFNQASTNEARQDIIESFTDSLGALASQVGGEAGALLGSAHGAFSDTLASVGSDAMDFGALELGNADTENPFAALDNGNLFADMNLKDTGFISEDSVGNSDSLPDNSWLKPGDVDRLLQRQADAGSSSVSRNYAAFRPSSAASDSTSKTTVSAENTSPSAATGSAHDADTAAKQRLQAITNEVRRGRSASHDTSASDTQVGNGRSAGLPTDGSATVGSNSGPSSQSAPPSVGSNKAPSPEPAPAAPKASASDSLAALARVEARSLGITEPEKIDEFVDTYVKQNTIPADPVPASGTNSATKVASNSTGHSTAGSLPRLPFVVGGVRDTNTDADASTNNCPVADSPDQLKDLTRKFMNTVRFGIPSDAGKEAQKECADSTSCTLNAKSETESVVSMTDSSEQRLARSLFEKGAKSGDIATAIASHLRPRIQKIMQARNFCPSSTDLQTLSAKDELKQFADIYSQALYEELGASGYITVDAKGCPAVQTADEKSNYATLERFSVYATEIAEMHRQLNIKLDLEGQGEATYCEHGDLKTAPFDMKSVIGSYFGSLGGRCDVAFRKATDTLIRQNWAAAQEDDDYEPSPASKRKCLSAKTAFLAMKKLEYGKDDVAASTDSSLKEDTITIESPHTGGVIQ